MRLMIVDDHAGVRKMIRQLLEASGDTLLECASGKEAVKAARDFKPDCVTMDIRMPDLSGLEAARAIRAIHPPGRIIIVTSYDLPFLRQAARELGASGYVLKDNLAQLRTVFVRGVAPSSQSGSAGEQKSESPQGNDQAVPVSPESSATVSAGASISDDQGPVSAGSVVRLRVLMVEDSENDCELIRRHLERNGFEPVVRRVENRSELRHALELDSWDIVFTDCRLPMFSGTEALALIRDMGLHIPTLCVTGSTEPAKTTEILDAGALELINKDDLTPLCAAIARVLNRKATQSDQPFRSRQCDGPVEQDNQPLLAANELPTVATIERTVGEDIAQFEAEKLELDFFVGAVGHDLSAPLRAIHTAAAELQSNHSGNLSLEGQRCLQKISENCRRLDERVDGLLTLARSEQGPMKWEIVNTAMLVHNAVAEIGSEAIRHRISYEAERLVDVRGDPALLRLVFVNLLANSVKFSAKREMPVIEVDCSLIDNKALFSISDNGAGFDMREAEELFRPFRRLHPNNDYAGSGLGLVTAQRVIHRHGGHIWAEAALNKGATFYFTLPCVSPVHSKEN